MKQTGSTDLSIPQVMVPCPIRKDGVPGAEAAIEEIEKKEAQMDDGILESQMG